MNNEEIKNILTKYPDKSKKDMIPVLQDIQNKFGLISESHINEVSNALNVPCSNIYGVATYYDQFKFTADSKVHIKICNGSACYINGYQDILTELRKHLNIQDNGISADGTYSLEKVPCFGACALSPIVEVNGTFYTKVTKRKIREIIKTIHE
ncbi:MAG: NAD(P)H-dependent oxidoreductase subunit E [Bacteroidota bacterium]